MMESDHKLKFAACTTLLILIISKYAACTAHAKCSLLKQSFPDCKCYAQLKNGWTTNNPIVDCSNLGLTSVPVPQTIHKIKIAEFILRDNLITSLPANTFKDLRIFRLDLSGNSITNVSDKAFDGLKDHINSLVLEGDGIDDPPKHAFYWGIRDIYSLKLKNYGSTYLDQTSDHSFFLAFKSLKELILENWRKLVFIEKEAFNGPTALKTLVLKNNKLENLPIDTLWSTHSKYIEKLVISHTIIERVSWGAFEKMENIKEIDLSWNEIKEVEENGFSGVGDTLEKIDLSNNVLTPNGFQGFKDIKSLKELDLSGNVDLKSVPDLSNLRTNGVFTLKLVNCEISRIYENDFIGIAPLLKSLDLSNNKIDTIHTNAFKGLASLKYLSLGLQTKYTKLKVPGSLTEATSLQELNISEQPLDEPSLWPVVSKLINLQVLNLDSTGVTEIPNLVFKNLTNLQELYMEKNKLTSLSQQSLLGPNQSLQSLFLSGNALTTMPMCTLYRYHFDSSLGMSLDDMTFNCDCDMKWLAIAAQNGNITFTSRGEPKCSNNKVFGEFMASLNCNINSTKGTCNDEFYTMFYIIQNKI